MFINKDCIEALSEIKEESVDLIYLDPPFFTQKKQKQKTRDNKKEYSFDDSWSSIDEYREYIQERLEVCKKVLNKTGSIFLHCDKAASHHLRIALDNVFGYSNFQSEIIWAYRRWSNAKKGLLNSHQVIFFYSKTKNFKFNQVFQDYSPSTNIDQIFQERVRNEHGKSAYKKDGDKPVLIEKKNGVPLSDVWEIPYLNPKAKERVGYPTQKPILLIEKIIELASDEGDVVLDPFCGSGTTMVSAKLLNRKFIGMDVSKDAIKLSKERVKNPVKSESALMKNGRQSYNNQCEKITAYLSEINAYPVQRNKGIDGFIKDGEEIKPIPVKVQREGESLKEAQDTLLKACVKNDYEIKVLISDEVSKDKFLKKENLHIVSKMKASQAHLSSILF
jgi:site-specific DNA-methyltransferase (adenine-specific)